MLWIRCVDVSGMLPRTCCVGVLFCVWLFCVGLCCFVCFVLFSPHGEDEESRHIKGNATRKHGEGIGKTVCSDLLWFVLL